MGRLPPTKSSMKLLTVLSAVFVTALLPSLGAAQAHLPNLKDRLKVHKERLPRPSHRLAVVHPRRLAVDQKDGRHQPRLLGKKDRHKTRREIRKVTHKLTAPHKHVKGG